jgi:hypothetical protein
MAENAMNKKVTWPPGHGPVAPVTAPHAPGPSHPQPGPATPVSGHNPSKIIGFTPINKAEVEARRRVSKVLEPSWLI